MQALQLVALGQATPQLVARYDQRPGLGGGNIARQGKPQLLGQSGLALGRPMATGQAQHLGAVWGRDSHVKAGVVFGPQRAGKQIAQLRQPFAFFGQGILQHWAAHAGQADMKINPHQPNPKRCNNASSCGGRVGAARS